MHFRLFLQYNKKTHYAQNNSRRKEKKKMKQSHTNLNSFNITSKGTTDDVKIFHICMCSVDT